MSVKQSLIRSKSEDSAAGWSMSPKQLKSPGTVRQHVFRAGADVSDIHICVLCLKALMNNAVSVTVAVFFHQDSCTRHLISHIRKLCMRPVARSNTHNK